MSCPNGPIEVTGRNVSDLLNEAHARAEAYQPLGPVCCGEERNTPYCPICGSKTEVDDGLYSLLAHLRSTAQKATTAATGRVAQRDIERGIGEGYRENRLKSAAKFTQWADLLAAKLKES